MKREADDEGGSINFYDAALNPVKDDGKFPLSFEWLRCAIYSRTPSCNRASLSGAAFFILCADSKEYAAFLLCRMLRDKLFDVSNFERRGPLPAFYSAQMWRRRRDCP